MSKATDFYPSPGIDTTGASLVSQAGATVLTEAVRSVGLDRALSKSLLPWRPETAVHDPAKVVLDLAVTLAAGGDCLADVAVLRAEPGLFGRVASDPTVSRVIDRLAATPDAALRAIAEARAAARARAWSLAGQHSPDHGVDAGAPLIIDVDATLLTAHSDKEGAAPTFKRGYGHHPLWCFVDRRPARGPTAGRPGAGGHRELRRAVSAGRLAQKVTGLAIVYCKALQVVEESSVLV